MELSYRGSEVFSNDKYHDFVAEFHREAAAHHIERTRWYMGHFDFRLLLAYVDGEIAGQSCAYKTTAVINGVQKDLWWSVDTFVLSRYRGLGIGKKLQAKLHEDCVNFSSLWYSRINGAIKRKLGARKLLSSKLNYYPINSLFSVVLAAFRRKNSINKKYLCRNKYINFHRLFSVRRYIEIKMSIDDLIKRSDEINKVLEDKNDFYIKRDVNYLTAKYIGNPSITGYDVYGLWSKDRKRVHAMYVLSKPYMHQTFSVYLKVCTLLDCFIFDNNVGHKDVIRAALINAANYRKVDGLLAFGTPKSILRLTYPVRGMELLSTCHSEAPILYPYVSFIDQDMEQMLP